MQKRINRDQISPSCLDRVIEKGITFLLIFTPLAIGTVQLWSVSVMEIAAFIIFGAWLAKVVVEGDAVLFKIPISFFIAVLIILVLLQTVPMPDWLLGSISPSANKIHKTFTGNGDGILKTISLYPDGTRDDLFKLLSYAALFFVIINHYRTRDQVTGLIRTIISMGCIITVFAVVQKMTWNGRLFWFYPIRKGLDSSWSGIWGPYINHNHFAAYMEMATPLGLGLFLYRMAGINTIPGLPFRRRFVNIFNSSGFPSAIFISIAVLIMSAAVFYSLSRGGIIGFSMSLLFLGGLISTRQSMKRGVKPIVTIGVIILLTVIIGSFGRIEHRFKQIGEKGHIKRLDVWSDTYGIVKDFPLFGTGLGTFKDVYPMYQTKNPRLIFEHAENDYIEILTDTGIAGLTIMLGLVTTFLFSTIRMWRSRRNKFVKYMAAGGISSCIAILVHSFTDFNLRIPANALLLTIITSAVYATLYNINSNNRSYKRIYTLTRRQSGVIIIAITVGIGFLLSFPLKTLLADYHYKKVADILDDPSTSYRDIRPISNETIQYYNDAIISLKKAVAVKPSVPFYYAELSGIYARLGKWVEIMNSVGASITSGAIPTEEAYNNSVKYLNRAVLLNPTNAGYHLTLGQTYEASGENPLLTEQELTRALMLAPKDISIRYSVAYYHLLKGRSSDTIEQARHLAAMDTSYLPPLSVHGELMSKMMTPAYMTRIYNSYLFKALEIAWRVSRDPDIVRRIAPDTPEAERVVMLFLESKGL